MAIGHKTMTGILAPFSYQSQIPKDNIPIDIAEGSNEATVSNETPPCAKNISNDYYRDSTHDPNSRSTHDIPRHQAPPSQKYKT